ncbi:DNA mismatch repair protein MutS [Eupransor demetentiae]|uniref:DNA mismatch repair protein MutS n=1 Tax=Eupransor demetentiae TaxID=3109584 RepID=A0ABM9N3G9_9LACO|nr:DNA mismatch repair ATPase MutS (MutS) [Lactobacillaceae bacterium LMG 33000]
MPKPEETPMMVQYHQIKAQYPDAFLFYRLGDFYELFEEDAIKGAKLLELTLTARNKNSKHPVPMAGIPHHAAQNYIDILVDQGYKVAIVEQMEDPAVAKGMVKREVIQLITPGTKWQDAPGDGKENNFLAALTYQDKSFGLAYIDLSTGELKATHMDSAADALDELRSLEVKEVVLPTSAGLPADFQAQLAETGWVLSYQSQPAEESLISYLTNGLLFENEKQTTALLLAYLFDTQKRSLDHIMPAQSYERLSFLKFNQATRVNLDLVENARTKKKADSLLALMDRTKTAMGGRLLKQWLLRPLRSLGEIQNRLDLVDAFLNEFFVRGAIQDQLKSVYDLERLAARAAMGTMNAKELVQLKRSLSAVPAMQKDLLDGPEKLKALGEKLDPLSDLTTLIDQALVDDPPVSVRDGDLIAEGYNDRLDEYRQVLTENQTWLTTFEQEERQATGISNLKVGYNKNFGYFIEVSKANIPKLDPDRYTRRQTLTNAERFVTPELKEHERLIIEARSQATNLEYELFVEIRDQVKSQIKRIQALAALVAQLDVLASLAEVAENQNFVRPNFDAQSAAVSIKQGRHPVIESILPAGEFVANDIEIGQDTTIQLITGPNMAGKSTYMREMALIVILAQIGSFVPATAVTLPIFDQVFTRIGANDDLARGQSTFMVEMAEANQALQGATSHSLILFDELGRGTATYDGMALAQAIIEYLEKNIHAKTLFSTHYHELTALAEQYPDIENVHVGAQVDADGQIHFQHQVQAGPADRSYGIHVAALAGLPEPLIKNANHILQDLEAGRDLASDKPLPVAPEARPVPDQLSQEVPLFDLSAPDEASEKVLTELDQVDISNLTPLEALNTLAKLQKMRSDHAQDS